MRRILDLFSRGLRLLLCIGMSTAFIGLILAVLLQVFARVFLPKVPSWTEEVSRIFLIWMVGCGAGLAMRQKSFVNVDLVVNLLPGRAKALLEALVDLLICLLMAVCLHQGWRHLALGRRQTSPALEIPMQYVFFALVVLAAGILLFAAVACVLNLATAAGRIPAEAKGK